MKQLPEKGSQGASRLLRQADRALQLGQYRTRRRNHDFLACFFIDQGATESQVVLQVVHQLQGSPCCGERLLQLIAGSAKLMKMDAPAIQLGAFADHRDSRAKIFLIMVEHQQVCTAQLAVKSFNQWHQVQRVGSGAGCGLCVPAFTIPSGDDERNSNSYADSQYAAYSLYPGSLFRRSKGTPANPAAVHSVSPVRWGQA